VSTTEEGSSRYHCFSILDIQSYRLVWRNDDSYTVLPRRLSFESSPVSIGLWSPPDLGPSMARLVGRLNGPETRRILRPDRMLGVLPTVSPVYMINIKSFSSILQFDTQRYLTYKLIVLRSLSLLPFQITFFIAASRLF